MKKPIVVLRALTLNVPVNHPKGFLMMIPVFESKKAAKDFYGKTWKEITNDQIIEVKVIKKEDQS